jgi:hypothetical protein
MECDAETIPTVHLVSFHAANSPVIAIHQLKSRQCLEQYSSSFFNISGEAGHSSVMLSSFVAHPQITAAEDPFHFATQDNPGEIQTWKCSQSLD